MTTYACYLNDRGDNLQVTGDSLLEIARALYEANYDGGKVVVERANGEVVGWADAGDYKSA